MNNEIWKSVVGYEQFYEVSNLGRIRRIALNLTGGRTGEIGFILNGSVTSNGYKQVKLCQKRHLIHKVVMLAFVGERPIGMCINHIDGDKLNNAVVNLEYCTQKQNVSHAIANGLRLARTNFTLSEEDVRQIRSRSGKLNISHLAKEFGCSRRTVNRVLNGEYWKTVV